MNIGDKITVLRKQKKLSQADLAKVAEVSREIIGRYERNEASPSIEVAKKIAAALEVSLDYLSGAEASIIDRKSLKRLEDIERLPDTDKNHILYALDGLIKAAKLNAL
jgi:transcriptional regulator with XRE-family HTH domain